MTYEEAVEKIDGLQTFRAAGPGLERIHLLLKRMGNPEKKLKFIHVGGTNGKGSTCTMLAEVFRAAGYRTGLYTSPHVTNFTERIQFNGEEIPREDLVELVEEYLPLILQMREEGHIITEFEAITAMGFAWFLKKQCDIVVLEVGMGGRFDATNAIETSLVSVITSISLDHVSILGDTIEKIAFEKSGIIKENGVCVCYGDQPRSAVNMIKITADVMHAKFIHTNPSNITLVDTSFQGTRFIWKNGLNLKIHLLGDHQLQNAAVVLTVLEELRKQGWKIPDEAIQQGMENAAIQARMEVLSLQPLVILDGAHNPGGTAALAKSIKRYSPKKKMIGLMGMLKDKDVKEALRSLCNTFDKVYTLTPEGYRAMPAEELAEIWQGYKVDAEPVASVEEGIELAIQEAQEKETGVLCCGSLYLAGDLRPALKKRLIMR